MSSPMAQAYIEQRNEGTDQTVEFEWDDCV